MAPRSADGVVLSELSTLNTTSPNTPLNKVVPPLPLCVETPGTQNHSHHAPHDMGRSVFEALCEAEACLVSAERHCVSPGKLTKGEPIGKGGFSVVFRCERHVACQAKFAALTLAALAALAPPSQLSSTLSPRLFTPPAKPVATITPPPAGPPPPLHALSPLPPFLAAPASQVHAA